MGINVESIGLGVDTSDLLKAIPALDIFGTSSKKMSKDADDAQKSLNKMSDVSKEVKKSLMELGAIAGLGLGLHEIIHATEESSLVLARLEARLRATGGTLGQTMEQIEEWSDKMSGSSIISSDALNDMQASALSFGSVTGSMFKRVRDDAVQLGSVFGDAGGQMFKLSRAMEAPETALRSLREIGIQFGKTQRDQIMNWEELGGKAKAQELILAAVEARYHSMSEVILHSFGGAMMQLRNFAGDLISFGKIKAFDSLTESLLEFNKLIHSEGVKNIADLFGTALGGALSMAVKLLTEMVHLFDWLINSSTNFFGVQISFGKALYVGWESIVNIIKFFGSTIEALVTSTFGWMSKLGEGVKDLLSGKWKKALIDFGSAQDKLHTGANQVGDAFNKWLDTQSKLGFTTESLKEMMARLRKEFEMGKNETDDGNKALTKRDQIVKDLMDKLQTEGDAQKALMLGRKDEAQFYGIVNDLAKQKITLTKDETASIKELIATIENRKAMQEDFKEITKTFDAELKKTMDTQEKQAKKAEESYGAISTAATEASNEISNAFVDMWSDPSRAVDDFQGYFIRAMKQMAAAALITPIIQPIIMDAFGGIAGSISGGGGSNTLASAGGLMAIGNSSGLINTGGLGAGIGASIGGSINSFGYSAFGLSPGSLTMGAGGAVPGSTITAGGSLGGASLTGLLGAGAIGALGGGLLGKLYGGNSTYGAIGGGIGGAAGFGIGSSMGTILGMGGGPVGMIIGTLLGSLFSLLGKPSDKAQGAAYDPVTGAITTAGNTNHPSQENAQIAQNAIGSIKQLVSGLQSLTGGRLDVTGQDTRTTNDWKWGTGKVAIKVGSRDGITAAVGSSQQTFGVGQEEAALKWITQNVIDNMVDLPADVATAMRHIDWTGELQDNLSLVEFAKNFQNNLKAMTDGSLSIQGSAYAAAVQQVEQYISEIDKFRDTTAQLGLSRGDADKALKSFVENLVGIKTAAGPGSQVHQALEALRGTFSAIGPLLETVGIGSARAAGLLQDAIDKIADGLEQSVHLQVLQMTDPKAYALQAWDEIFKAMKADMIESGASLVELEELNGLKRAEIVKQFAEKTVDTTKAIYSVIEKAQKSQLDAAMNLKSVWAGVADEIRRTALGLRLDTNLSPLSPQARRDLAFSELDMALQRERAGDPAAAGEVQTLAKQALEASRAVNASSLEYAKDFDRAMGALSDAQGYAGAQMNYQAQQVTLLQGILDALTASQGTGSSGTAAGFGKSDFMAFGRAYDSALTASGKSADDFIGSAAFAPWQEGFKEIIGNTNDAGFLESLLGGVSAHGANDPNAGVYSEQSNSIRARLKAIRGYAGGGDNIGGLSIVGENGPELLNLPQGSSVKSNGETQNIINFGQRANLARQDMLISISDDGFRKLSGQVGILAKSVDNLSRKVSGLKS